MRRWLDVILNRHSTEPQDERSVNAALIERMKAEQERLNRAQADIEALDTRLSLHARNPRAHR